MTRELEHEVKTILNETAGIPQDADPSAHLYDELGVGSIDALLLLDAVERRFNIRVPDEEWIEATSVRQVAALVRRLMPAEGA